MRAMRQLLALCALVLVAGCGDDTSVGPDMSMPADLAPGPDLAVRLPDGVVCGQMSCPVGQSCCVMTSGNMTTSQMCIAAGGQCTGGAVLACDGPEDCSNASMPFCCGTIKFTGGGPDGGATMFNGGNAMCTGTCDFNFGGGMVTTRLCHADVDCTGLTAFGQNLNQCCSSAMAPGLHFCAAALGLGGITCP